VLLQTDLKFILNPSTYSRASRQSAYKTHHSVHDEIVRAIDSGDVCGLVLLDLSAAFDHKILLSVLNRCFGVAGLAFNWRESYLSHRRQTFQVDAHQSGPFTTDCSVPQGSVLGHLKFVCYTEDSADLITGYHLSYHLYAEDTQLG